MLTEINIDALVGPTHHYGGLGVGNIASLEHRNQVSRPRQAALEGLAKAAWVARQGVPQFIWLPPLRPRLQLLSQVGFGGSLEQQLQEAALMAPRILSAAFSSAFMWAANSATVTPAADSSDNRYHCTPANLISSWHRSYEASERGTDLQRIFGAAEHIQLHSPLPSIVPLRDEGAANHMRLCDPTGMHGFNVFVYGEDEQNSGSVSDFLPRQTRAACQAIARRHKLPAEKTFFLRQHPIAISSGVFHNDVIATSHRDLLIHHCQAFIDGGAELQRLEAAFESITGRALRRIEVGNDRLTLVDAVRSYFFNSQILTCPANRGAPQRTWLLCPQQCQEIESARRLIQQLVDDSQIPIDGVHFVSLAESMANGGGPACLRLRVPADGQLLTRLDSRLQMTSELEQRLAGVIERYYPERLEFLDLTNADFVDSVQQAGQALAHACR